MNITKLVTSFLTTTLLTWSLAFTTPALAATTRWVNDNNPSPPLTAPGTSCNNPGYSTIQAAISASAPGDTVMVCAGTYVGGNNVGSAKTGLRILAADTLGTVDVTGSGTWGFRIRADNVELRGFEIYGFVGATNCGVLVDGGGDAASIRDNLIRNNWHGVCLMASNNNHVHGNTIRDHAGLGDGVRIIPSATRGRDNDIDHNTIRDNAGRAIFVGNDACPSTPLNIGSTEINFNTVRMNGGGASNAIVMRSVRNGEVSFNTVNNNSNPDGAIRVDCDTRALEVEFNTTNNNSMDGISVDDSHNLNIEDNTARFNGDNGVGVTSTDGSFFEDNDGRGNAGPDFSADAYTVINNTFDNNQCNDAVPSTAAWDC